MCQINPISSKFADESEHIRLLRQQLSGDKRDVNVKESVIRDPQTSAVIEVMQRLLQQDKV